MKGGARKLAARMGVALALLAPPGCAAARVPSCISSDATAEEARARTEASVGRIRRMWEELSKKHEALLEELDALREDGIYGSSPISSRFIFDAALPNIESILRHLKGAVGRLQGRLGEGADVRTLAQEACSIEAFSEVLAGHAGRMVERSFSEINAIRKAQEGGQEGL